MDSNSNPITNANPGMPAIPNPPAPAPVVPTPSDAMPSIPTPVDNTPAPTPATSSVPTFASSNPAAEAAPVVPTTSSTPTSFGLDSSYNTGYNTTVSSTNSSFDPSSVASFFTPETPSIANGGMIAATEPITEPDPIPEPDPIEVELNAPFQAAAPVPGSIGSAVSVPKEGEEAKNEKAQSKKGGLFGKKSAAKEEKVETPAEAPAPVDTNTVLDSNSAIVSLEPIVNPNNPFLNQNATPAPVPTQPVVAPEPVAMAPAAAVEPIAQAPQVAPVTPVVPATPELQPEVQKVATPEQMPVAPAAEAPAMAPAMSDASMMGAAPAPEIPQLDPNNPLPMPGDPMMGNPMLENPMMQNPMMPDPMMMADPTQAMAPASPDMPFAFDSANTQMNPFAEAASLNANSNIPIGGAPEKAKNNKKLLIIAGSAVAVLLIGVVAVVAMSGNGGRKSPSKVADNPTPAPQLTVPTSGTTICTKKYDEDRLALFTGAENGSKNITIKYKDNLIDSISMNDTIDFDNETSRKSGLRTLKDEYNADFEKYGIEDDTAFSTEYVRDVLSITGTRSLASVSSLDPSIVKLFGIISSDGDFVAEDTVADLEEKGYTCSEKGSSAKDDETEIDEEAEESEDLVKEEGSDDAEETLKSQEPVDEFVF